MIITDSINSRATVLHRAPAAIAADIRVARSWEDWRLSCAERLTDLQPDWDALLEKPEATWTDEDQDLFGRLSDALKFLGDCSTRGCCANRPAAMPRNRVEALAGFLARFEPVPGIHGLPGNLWRVQAPNAVVGGRDVHDGDELLVDMDRDPVPGELAATFVRTSDAGWQPCVGVFDEVDGTPSLFSEKAPGQRVLVARGVVTLGTIVAVRSWKDVYEDGCVHSVHEAIDLGVQPVRWTP